jgi:DNA-binding transcriptional ArsR family regulator
LLFSKNNRNIAINMGKSKTEQFTERQNRMAAWARALSHPARIAILEVLISRGECMCGDIVDDLPLSQATVSQHLKVMKEAGLIQGDIEGRIVCYCVDAVACRKAWADLQSLFTAACNCCI